MKNVTKTSLVLFIFVCFAVLMAENVFADQFSTPKFIAVSVQKTDTDFKVNGLRIANGEYAYSDSVYVGQNDGKVVSFQGKTLGYFPVDSLKTILCVDSFNQKSRKIEGGCKETPMGDLLINIPYFPNGKFADIYNEKGEKVFTIDLTSIATCNENATCDQGENQENCPSDCNVDNILSKIKTKESNPEQEVQSKKGSLLYLLAAIFILTFTLVFYFIWRKQRNKQGF